MSPPDTPAPPAAALPTGHRIRSTRRRLGLTLQQLAAAAQMDKGFLSRVERGEKSASIATIQSIAKALKLSVGSLLGEVGDDDEVQIVRAHERPGLGVPRDPGGHAYAALTLSGRGKPFSAFVVDVGTDTGRVVGTHPGLELMVVMAGAVKVTFAGRTVKLQRGDSAVFPGYIQHRIERVGARAAQVLIVVGSG